MLAEGYDLGKIVQRVAEIMDMELEKILKQGKDRKKTLAHSILCYWATDYLGISQFELVQLLNVTPPAISLAVRRGKAIVRSQSFCFKLIYNLMNVPQHAVTDRAIFLMVFFLLLKFNYRGILMVHNGVTFQYPSLGYNQF